jgi:hypothetical protein
MIRKKEGSGNLGFADLRKDYGRCHAEKSRVILTLPVSRRIRKN